MPGTAFQSTVGDNRGERGLASLVICHALHSGHLEFTGEEVPSSSEP